MFITFEGIEGSGKGSVIATVAEYLRAAGREALLTREPGGCRLGRALRTQLLDMRNAGITPEAELFLYLADRAQHVHEIIVPALRAGKVVICDRYSDSTLAYQGYGRGRDAALLRSLNDVAAKGLKPDLTLLLDLPAAEGLARARARNILENKVESEGRFEAEDLAFHCLVREGFLELARQESERFAVIDASRPLTEVSAVAFWLVGRQLGLPA